MEFIVAES